MLSCAVLAFTGCSSPEPGTPESEDTATDAQTESAGDALRRVIEQANNRQWGPQWDALVPQHQALVSRDRFMECRQQEDPGGSFSFDKVIDVYEEEIGLPGTEERIDTTAVTYQLTVRSGVVSETANQTGHVHLLDGAWRWLLSPEHVEALKAGNCPS